MPPRKLGRLESVNLRQYWEDEARDFNAWLAQGDNLAVLSDTLGMELELEGTEVPVGPFKADIVARDLSSDSRVVIENQLEKTNHDHLGKIISYASGLTATVMIWIAREFTEEHRRALDFLNEQAAPNLRCYGIEMQLWKIGESEPAPLFKIISSPNEYTSEIKVDGTSGEISETQALYLELWSGFRDYGRERGTFLQLRKPRPQHWFTIALGRSSFSLSLTASMQNQRLGCETYLSGRNAKQLFRLLTEYKEQLHAQTGPLEWQELPEKQACRVVLYKQCDVRNKANWRAAYEWFLEEAEKFHKAFSPVIRSLPVPDEEPNGGAE